MRKGISLGVTLVEMMIVLFIIALLAVAALRALPGDDQRVHEAARLINNYLGTARNRAMEIGRPVGVIFQRFNNRPDACTTLQQCEVPVPYCGDSADAVVMVQDWTWRPDGWPYWDEVRSESGQLVRVNTYRCANDKPPILFYRVLKVRVRANDFAPNTLRYGDLMQLDGKGPYYTIVKDTWNNIDDPKDPHMYPPYVPSTPSTALHMLTQQVTAWPNFRYSPPDFPEDANGYIQFTAGNDLDTGQDAAHPMDGWIDNYCLTLVLEAPLLQTTPWKEFRNISLPDPVPVYTNRESLHRTFCSGPYAFQIRRQPSGQKFAVKSATQILQLPINTAVDLAFSGVGSAMDANYFARNGVDDKSSPVMIIFSPTGSVEGVYCNRASGYGAYPAMSPIFLLVGRLDRAPVLVADTNGTHYEALTAAPPEEQLPNWADPKSLWIAIQPQTGFISTGDMHPLPKDTAGNYLVDWTQTGSCFAWPYVPGPPSLRDWRTAIEHSRIFARQAQAIGGR